jgi:hypothetical protein
VVMVRVIAFRVEATSYCVSICSRCSNLSQEVVTSFGFPLRLAREEIESKYTTVLMLMLMNRRVSGGGGRALLLLVSASVLDGLGEVRRYTKRGASRSQLIRGQVALHASSLTWATNVRRCLL